LILRHEGFSPTTLSLSFSLSPLLIYLSLQASRQCMLWASGWEE
jgi:hypothetical protein